MTFLRGPRFAVYLSGLVSSKTCLSNVAGDCGCWGCLVTTSWSYHNIDSERETRTQVSGPGLFYPTKQRGALGRLQRTSVLLYPLGQFTWDMWPAPPWKEKYSVTVCPISNKYLLREWICICSFDLNYCLQKIQWKCKYVFWEWQPIKLLNPHHEFIEPILGT